MTTEKKAKREIPYFARGRIRHAYDQVITQAARLASFAACPPLPDGGAVEERQNALAIDDLIAFALHVRRLIETTGIANKVGKTPVVVFANGTKQSLPIIRVVNTIIHHRQIEILRRKSDMSAPGIDISYTDWLEDRKRGHVPVVLTKSDRGGFIAFRIDSFVAAVIEGIVDPVVEHCDDRGLYLEDTDLD